MKELIFLNVGGAGTRMGDKTWQILSKEHDLAIPIAQSDPDPLYDNKTISCELVSGKYSPRNLFIDSSPEVVDEVRQGPRKQLYNLSNYITGKEDAANNYVRGNYTIGKQIIDICEQRIVKTLEACDHINGLVISCSMSGGTGSGLTNLILDRINSNNMLGRKPIQINMVLPSPRFSDTVVEPYNFVMGLGDLKFIDCSKYLVGFDNQQLYKLCQARGIEEPGYNEINQLIGQSVSAMTHQFRTTNSCGSMSELATNLIPYKEAFLVSPSLSATNDVAKIKTAVGSLYNSAICLNSYRTFGRETIMSTYGVIRGEISHFEALNALNVAKKDYKFCNWNLANLKLKSSKFQLKQSYKENIVEGVMLINSDSSRQILDRINSKYDRLYQRRSFLHWFVGEGIDESSVTCGRQNTALLDKEYEEMAVQSQEFDEVGYYQ